MPQDYLEQLRQGLGNARSGGMTMPDMPAGYERLEDGHVLTIGAHDWRVVVGSGHSPEHACLYCAALKIMISGDQILPIITSNVSVHPTEPNANPLALDGLARQVPPTPATPACCRRTTCPFTACESACAD